MLSASALMGDVALMVGTRSPVVRAIGVELTRCGARVATVGPQVDADWFDAQAQPDDLTQTAAAFGRVEQALGPVTILIHAGLLEIGANFAPAEDAPRLDDTPGHSVFAWSKALLERRRADARASAILALGRSLANKGGLGLSPLAVNQAAIEAQVRNYAAEWARYGIRTNLLLAGLVEGERFPHPLPEGVERGSLAPAGRLADPREIARPALYLCSRYAAYVTGATVTVDGGYAIKRSNSNPAYDPPAVFAGGPVPALLSP
jgi:NAD(P)-dependent dehydrogenase (short-subunit alcohol dehydrogenase family)